MSSPINGLGAASPLNPLSSPSRLNGLTSAPTPASPSRGSDSVELSGDVSRYLSVLKSGDVRSDKVANARAAIEAGTYETDEKLDVAIDRLLEDLD